jgi:osmotically-inducible protein OsmY
VKARLRWDVWLNGSRINSVVKDGKVTLAGTIGNAISEDRAIDDAWVNGVTSVDCSGLKVDSQAHTVARQEFTDATKSDSEIKLAVQASLHLDPRVSAFSPDVTVEGGMVVFGGNVGNLKAKTSAAQDAINIVGVGVDNFLKVRPKGRPTDTQTGNELKAALYWDPMVDSSTITVAVINRVA